MDYFADELEEDIPVYSDIEDFEEPEEPRKKLNWKGRVFDDDQFENDSEWVSERVLNGSGSWTTTTKKNENNAPLSNPRLVQLCIKVNNLKAIEPEKALSLPEGGWVAPRVKKVKESRDYPTLRMSPELECETITRTTMPRFNKTKAVDATKSFFNPPTEDDSKEWVKVGQQLKTMWQTKQKICSRFNCNCGFAHNISEYQPLRCKFQENCQNNDCKFIHDDENKEQYIARTGKKFTAVEQVQTPAKKTKLCKFADKCTRKNCLFAHSLEELNPQFCNFDTKCKRQMQCMFMHSFETKESYVQRVMEM